MKNKIDIKLQSIKTNRQIVEVLKKSKKFYASFLIIYISKYGDKSSLQYALLVNKSQFKLSTTRNKVKRQIKNILLRNALQGGLKILFKPTILYLKKTFSEIEHFIINIIKKYQNGK